MKKSLIALLLVLCTLLTACSGGAPKAADPDDFEYNTSDRGIRITAYKGTDEVVLIPDELDGKSVTDIHSKAFAGNRYMKTIILPERTYIVSKQFQACEVLERIEILGETPVQSFEAPESLRELIAPKSTSVSLTISKGVNIQLVDASSAKFMRNYIAFDEGYEPVISELKVSDELFNGYFYFRDRGMVISLTADGDDAYKITDENRADVWCAFCNNSKVTVNGVVLTSDKTNTFHQEFGSY